MMFNRRYNCGLLNMSRTIEVEACKILVAAAKLELRVRLGEALAALSHEVE